MGVAVGLVGPSRDLAEPIALSPTVRHSLVEGRNIPPFFKGYDLIVRERS